MIFIGGAGATAEAARLMRRVQRDLDRRAERLKQRRMARRRANSRYYLDHAPTSAPYTCACLCGGCGYFLDGDGNEKDQNCPSCGAIQWMDLTIEAIVERVRDLEDDERMEVPVEAQRIVIATTLAIPALLLLGAVTHSLVSAGQLLTSMHALVLIIAVLAFSAFLPVAAFVLPRYVAAALRPERLPRRWRRPTRLPAWEQPPDHVVQEKIVAIGPTLVAPFSGLPCVAFEVGIQIDGTLPGRPEWLLREQRASTVVVEQSEFTDDEVVLELPLEPIEMPETPELRRFLRERGLSLADGELQFFERRVEPGDVVSIAVFDDALCAIRS